MGRDRNTQNIFKAIHEGKWLSIEYRNKEQKITRYWIAVQNIDVRHRSLSVEGFHLADFTVLNLKCVYLDSILSSSVVEGSYYQVNAYLLKDIDENPEKYEPMFGHTANLKILNYLIECNRLDTQPYQYDYSLIHRLDCDCFSGDRYLLDDRQFGEIVNCFQEEATRGNLQKNYKLKQLCMNVLSVPVYGKGKKSGSPNTE